MISGKMPYRDPEVDKQAYLAWYEEGTILRACQRMKDRGIYSKRKTPFTPDAVRKAAVRHMVYNYDEARSTLLKLYADNGYEVEESKIDRFMIKMAVTALHNPERVRFWMKEHGLLEKHSTYLKSLIAI